MASNPVSSMGISKGYVCRRTFLDFHLIQVHQNNVLVTDDKRAVLSDFGLSKILEDLGPTGTTTATIAGSVRWQAPEQITINEEDDTYGVSKPKPPIDVWAFGCTAYEVSF